MFLQRNDCVGYVVRSDTLDSILTGLNFGWLKKKALRNFTPITYIRFTERSCYDADDTHEDFNRMIQGMVPDGDVAEETVRSLDASMPVFWDAINDDVDIAEELLQGLAAGSLRGGGEAQASATGEPAADGGDTTMTDEEDETTMKEGAALAVSDSAMSDTASKRKKQKFRDPAVYMYMKTLFPWHNVKEGVVSVDGPPFEHRDSDTGSWRTIVTFSNGRLYQKRISDVYGTMYDVRAIFGSTTPPTATTTTTTTATATGLNESDSRPSEPASGDPAASDGEAATDRESGENQLDDGWLDESQRPVDPATWRGPPLMLFQWTLIGNDGTVYRATRWNRLTEDDELAS